MRPLRLAVALLLVLPAAACSQSPAPTPSPFAGCATLPTGAKNQLPALKLPCFTGGASVDLTALRGPVMINLWASWCQPCRTELPQVQKLADQNPGLTVVTVDSGDVREAGGSFADAVGVRVPTLFDANKKLLTRIKSVDLPATVFIDAAGKETVYRLPLSDPATMAAQVRAGTGVQVTVTK